jgi:hypothetical protein
MNSKINCENFICSVGRRGGEWGGVDLANKIGGTIGGAATGAGCMKLQSFHRRAKVGKVASKSSKEGRREHGALEFFFAQAGKLHFCHVLYKTVLQHFANSLFSSTGCIAAKTEKSNFLAPNATVTKNLLLASRWTKTDKWEIRITISVYETVGSYI